MRITNGVTPTLASAVVAFTAPSISSAAPAARDFGGFDWIAHFLASRGYTVLQPNFRGSAGFGRNWEEAGHGEWGIGVMQHDVTDGVAALIEDGIADPERASFGVNRLASRERH